MKITPDVIADALGASITSTTPLAGGDISGASKLGLSDGRIVVAKAGPLVDIEADMLRAIAMTGSPCPSVLAQGDCWLVMEWIESQSTASRWDALARTLRQLHRSAPAHYGWDEDYAFGAVVIPNARRDDWAQFWADNRLLCHLPHIEPQLGERIKRLAARTGELLPTTPPPSLLHGDLWGGNVIWSGGKAYLIDPASYYGHHEVDWAMLTLFDHPPDSFFTQFDTEPGWRERQPLYRLWPWLVHLRLFGDGYRAAVEKELGALGF